jgi:predicted regulator of Ras-like GTPase activity (Roadblock/LC7/MglB family)
MVGSAPVDAARAIADLTEISSQIEQVVLVDERGAVLASNLDEDARAQQLADGAARLVEEAAGVADRELVHLEAALAEGSVFVVREGGRTIAATTGPDPTVGLVVYDLKSALRGLDPPQAKKRAPRRKQADDAA